MQEVLNWCGGRSEVSAVPLPRYLRAWLVTRGMSTSPRQARIQPAGPSERRHRRPRLLLIIRLASPTYLPLSLICVHWRTCPMPIVELVVDNVLWNSVLALYFKTGAWQNIYFVFHTGIGDICISYHLPCRQYKQWCWSCCKTLET